MSRCNLKFYHTDHFIKCLDKTLCISRFIFYLFCHYFGRITQYRRFLWFKETSALKGKLFSIIRNLLQFDMCNWLASDIKHQLVLKFCFLTWKAIQSLCAFTVVSESTTAWTSKWLRFSLSVYFHTFWYVCGVLSVFFLY